MTRSTMSPERWRRAFTIFHDAIACDAGDRAAFLTVACLGDHGIRQATEQLVSAHESAGDFLEEPAVRFLTADVAADPIGRGLTR